jgi:hypothetical protein
VGENRANVRKAIAELLSFLGELDVQVAREDLVIALAVRQLLG